MNYARRLIEGIENAKIEGSFWKEKACNPLFNFN